MANVDNMQVPLRSMHMKARVALGTNWSNLSKAPLFLVAARRSLEKAKAGARRTMRPSRKLLRLLRLLRLSQAQKKLHPGAL